jgi:hypothetical protein
VYFLLEGQIGYVLPRYNNEEYHSINQGDHFGHEDLSRISKMDDVHLQSLLSSKTGSMFNRNFTARAQKDCEMLGLSNRDILIMKMGFSEEF